MARAQETDDFRSGCPIASTMEIIGDRWTMVLVRDLVNGKRRYSEFLDSPEHIASNILTARLKALEARGLIAARAYQQKPKRLEYALTKRGAALLPVLQEICRWGEANLADRWKAPASFMAKTAGDLA